MLKLKGFEDVQAFYEAIPENSFSALLVGEVGTGKTVMCETLPGKTLIHSFDPRGLESIEQSIKDKDILPDVRWEKSTASKPLAGAWRQEFNRLKRDNIFKEFDNYVIDSYTFFSQMFIDQIAKENSRKNGLLTLPDWQTLGNIIKDSLKECCALPCRFILTAHIIALTETDMTGKERVTAYTIYANPKLQLYIPTLFSEVYCLRTKTIGGKPTRELITDRYQNYLAKTRKGRGGKFNLVEKPDFSILLNKLNQ